MCGITGLFGKNASKDDLESMMAVASRRGPEESKDVEVDGGILGHSLLAFVREGNNPQPLIEDDSVMVYNGEVYNWEELNEKYDFNAKNDTEVLLRGIKKKGAEFLKEIDGQFAFIAQINGETVVGRDKWGISPLVYGVNDSGEMAIASTPEALYRAGVEHARTVPAGTYGNVNCEDIDLEFWFELPKNQEQASSSPEDILRKAKQSVEARIPERREVVYTAMGGIDSQFVTATVARATKGQFGGAVTVVPWSAEDPDNMILGDYYDAKATVEMLKNEGIEIDHYVVQLNPEYIDGALDRVLAVLGPDYFNVCCGLAEDLVATTVRNNGGKAIMTAGGPDEAGRSYKPWTLAHRKGLEDGFYAVCDQFSSAEGVRAGLVFGEQGLENRVPLAFLIEESQYIIADEKQQIEDWGDGKDPFRIGMKDKIFWRAALEDVLPESSLNAPKATIHGASGSKLALYHVALRDSQYQSEREEFIEQAVKKDWNGIVFGPLRKLDPENIITEGQLYCLWRWSKLDPKQFKRGGDVRYDYSDNGIAYYESSLDTKVDRPICYDWMFHPDARTR